MPSAAAATLLRNTSSVRMASLKPSPGSAHPGAQPAGGNSCKAQPRQWMRGDHVDALGHRPGRACRPAPGRPTGPCAAARRAPAPRRRCRGHPARTPRRSLQCRRWRSRSSRRSAPRCRPRQPGFAAGQARPRPSRPRAPTAQRRRWPRHGPPAAASVARCSALPSSEIAPEPRPCIAKAKVGQAAVAGQGLAGQAQHAGVQLLAGAAMGRARHRMAQPAGLAQLAHQLAAGAVQVMVAVHIAHLSGQPRRRVRWANWRWCGVQERPVQRIPAGRPGGSRGSSGTHLSCLQNCGTSRARRRPAWARWKSCVSMHRAWAWASASMAWSTPMSHSWCSMVLVMPLAKAGALRPVPPAQACASGPAARPGSTRRLKKPQSSACVAGQ